MIVQIQLTRDRLEERPSPSQVKPGEGGAWVEFRGIVRQEEDGRPIAGLEYEAYDTMAMRVMRRIIDELEHQHPCLAMFVTHRLGPIAVGEAAIQVAIVARHRSEAFAMLQGFMDRLKQDVPIWKCRVIPADNGPAQLSTDP